MLPLTYAALALLSDVRPHQRRVIVAGGTHGNEYTGIYVLDRLQHMQAEIEDEYPTLRVETLLANPDAHRRNCRFMDDDLNRMFTDELLSSNPLPGVHEAARAHEIARFAAGDGGTEGGGEGEAALCIDMHTTTSNMGCTIIVNTWSPLTLHAAAYVQAHWEAECEADDAAAAAALRAACASAAGGGGDGAGAPPPASPPQHHPLRVMLQDGDTRATCPHLCSIGHDGLEIEVGPTPQGLVRADAVLSTERALRLLLRYFDLHTRGDAPEPPAAIEVFLDRGKVPFEPSLRPESAIPAALVHAALQDGDFRPLRTGEPLFQRLDGSVVPYDGRCGDEVYPVFVNEAAYYYRQSGSGVGMTTKVMWPMPDLEPVDGEVQQQQQQQEKEEEGGATVTAEEVSS